MDRKTRDNQLAMIISKRHIPRRTVLRGMGAAIALPFLEAMAPATQAAQSEGPTRVVCIEMVHGAAGSTVKGAARNLWAPAEVGSQFDLTPSSLSPLEPYREYLTIVSNTDVHNADAFEDSELGGDHNRSSAVFLTQAHPKHTEGADLQAGTSFDQLVAQQSEGSTRIPSVQLCIENVQQSGSFMPGYASAYMNTISWASPRQPLPMIQDPRAVFDQLFGVSGANRPAELSILDWVMHETTRLSRKLGPGDRHRLDEYLDDIREVERRIQKIEAYNASHDRPSGVPEDFEEHVKLMFDLQVQAFASDVTRVVAFKMGRDGSGRVYPASGVTQSFHGASHHAEKEEKIDLFAQINKYHVGLVADFMEKLKNVQEGDANLLDRTLILYGSPMGDSNLHNHKRCPLFLAGHANGLLRGNVHLKASDGTPMANVMLTLLNDLGMDDVERFGDSKGRFGLT